VQVNPDIRKEKWTEHEDNKLIELVNTHGSCWAEIARGMAVRTGLEQCTRIDVCHPKHLSPLMLALLSSQRSCAQRC
jgi:Myb-like DNA-binding domain